VFEETEDEQAEVVEELYDSPRVTRGLSKDVDQDGQIIIRMGWVSG